MSLQAPPPVAANPIELIARDLRNEWRTPVPYPPGDTTFDLRRAGAMLRNPLPLLLDGYARYGPVYTLRLLSSKVIVLLGPEANHHLLVANQANFSWREGSFANLIPLLGDGLLTIDGDFHRRSRKIMLPVFHHEHIAAALETMTVETEQAMSAWRTGDRVDLYDWTRKLALRIAMRALFGLDPDGPAARSVDAARLFNEALHFFSYDLPVQWLRGPGTPWRRMQRARHELDRLIYSEIATRRRTGERGLDLLSLLLDASDEDGTRLSDRHVRDEVMTLLFAGHDTTTSTVAFMFYELARHPDVTDAAAGGAGRAAGRRADADRRAADARRACRSSSRCSTRRCACTRRRGSGRGARSSRSRSRGFRAPAGLRCSTRRGPATGCRTCGMTRMRSGPSASRPRPSGRCRRARTCRSAPGRARASACASASSRSG